MTIMVKDTGESLEKISEDDIVKLITMDSGLSMTLKFLSLLV